VTYDRQVVAYKNYFLDLYRELPDNVQAKIEWTLNLIRVTRQVPEKYFKHLEGMKGLYEIRVEIGGNIYRIFSLFRQGKFSSSWKCFSKENSKDTKARIRKST
jgi:phage-related protein